VPSHFPGDRIELETTYNIAHIGSAPSDTILRRFGSDKYSGLYHCRFRKNGDQYCNTTEWGGVAVTLLFQNRKVSISNLGWSSGYRGWCLSLLSSFLPVKCRHSVYINLFLPDALFFYHSILELLISSWNNQQMHKTGRIIQKSLKCIFLNIS
jgi:hypothetical protein